MSGRFTPAASTFTRISPSPATGRGSSTACSASAGPFPPRIAMAVMVASVMRASYPAFRDRLDTGPDRDYYSPYGHSCTQAVILPAPGSVRPGAAGVLQHHPAVGPEHGPGARAPRQPGALHILPLEARPRRCPAPRRAGAHQLPAGHLEILAGAVHRPGPGRRLDQAPQ